MKFTNIRVYNFENALRGMRNPKNSWDLSDSSFGIVKLDDDCGLDTASKWADAVAASQSAPKNLNTKDIRQDYQLWLWKNGILEVDEKKEFGEVAFIGPKDLKLAQTLIKAGPEHRKFMRQIFVTVDITAPLYFWKEFDTYKVGTVANSTSTMHKLTAKEITLENFEIDDFHDIPYGGSEFIETSLIPYLEHLRKTYVDMQELLEQADDLSEALQKQMKEQAQTAWKELIRWLPESWLQTRTVTMSYENLLAICSKGQRRFHKLTEWSGTDKKDSFIKFARRLPYSQELIFLDEISE